MSEAKHTPGPWEVELIVGLPRVIAYSRKSDCRVIADLHIQEGIGALKGNPALVNLIAANAHLIAAAPDLLDVLKRLSSFEFRHQGITEGPLATILNQAAAVIAKAEGRA